MKVDTCFWVGEFVADVERRLSRADVCTPIYIYFLISATVQRTSSIKRRVVPRQPSIELSATILRPMGAKVPNNQQRYRH